jgi:uncharacterized membrane protein YadS
MTKDEMTMGKAARNETKKLEATYLNNIAISFFVAGLVLPCITLMQNMDVLANDPLTHLLTVKGFLLVAATIAALVLSVKIHNLARSALKEIED